MIHHPSGLQVFLNPDGERLVLLRDGWQAHRCDGDLSGGSATPLGDGSTVSSDDVMRSLRLEQDGSSVSCDHVEN